MVLFQDVYLTYMNQSVQLRIYHTHPTRREKSRSFQILYQYELPQQIHKIIKSHKIIQKTKGSPFFLL